MFRILCKSKIHRATVTRIELNYQGSITIDEELMEIADILPGERLEIFNLNNGERFSTYAIKGKRNLGMVCINGAAARLAEVADKIIIVSYVLVEEKEAKNFKSRVILVDDKNRPIKG